MHLLVLSAFRPYSGDVPGSQVPVSMHLLVLSAFRRQTWGVDGFPAHVSMHLLVLSAFRLMMRSTGSAHIWSQCTFWCSVLSDKKEDAEWLLSLLVSMHLLVLSAFRHTRDGQQRVAEQVSMHLLVLSAFRLCSFSRVRFPGPGLNAPSGAQCFPTQFCYADTDSLHMVSMHLLVLSAFRPKGLTTTETPSSLNAPSGAQCFPTLKLQRLALATGRLNAPSGAQCFPTLGSRSRTTWRRIVSMHLLVLSAFRQHTASFRP